MPSTVGVVAGGRLNTPLALKPALWLDAADTSTITHSSGAVSQWNDKSGNGRHVTQGTAAAQPTTGASAINGRNVIDFAADWMVTASASPWAFLHDGTVWTALVIGQAGTSSDPNAIYAFLGNGGTDSSLTGAALSYDDRTSSSRNNAIFCGVSKGTTSQWPILGAANNAFTPNAPHRLRVEFAPGAAAAADRLTVMVDGTAVTDNNTSTVAPSTGSASEALAIGAVRTSGLQALVGKLAEVVIVPRALTATEVTQWNAYVSAKWNL